MFPNGVPGVALLLLRLSVAILFLVDGTMGWRLVSSIWILASVTLLGVALFAGLMTPYCATLCGLIELRLLFLAGHESAFRLGMASLSSATLAMIGPGAYSLDARIFGRRLVKLPDSAAGDFE